MAPADRKILNFGEFTLDLDRSALLFAGVAVKLRPKSFDVLSYLVTHAGRLVSKDEILEAVWGKTVVTDDSLTQCLIDIRKAMGDKSRNMIQTVPRRGYIFDIPVSDGVPSSESRSASRPLWRRNALPVLMLLAAGLLWIVFQRFSGPVNNAAVQAYTPLSRSIAVLPFVDMSPNNDRGYFSDGIAEEILNLLAQSELQVIARTSSFSFKTRQIDIQTIARRLRVAHVVEGSVRQTGDNFRISAQVIDGSSGLAIWSQDFEFVVQELVDVQQEIANEIANVIIADANETTRTFSSSTRNVSAHELMLLARHYEQQVKSKSDVDLQTLTKAISLYRDATRADPQSALVHSKLASALMYAGDLASAEAPIFKALTIDPDLSEVQETVGKYYWARGLPGAGAAMKRAVELNPNNADALASYAYWYWMQGNDDGIAQLYRRAVELDPLSLSRYADLGSFLAKQNSDDETYEVIETIENLFTGVQAIHVVADLLQLTGNIDQSIAWTLRARELEPELAANNWQLAELYAQIGDFETASQLQPDPGLGLLYRMRRYDEMIDLGEFLMIEQPDDILVRYLLAFAYNATGNHVAAVHVIESTGLHESVYVEIRQAIDIEAFITLISAVDGAGDHPRAKKLAEYWSNREHPDSNDWWINAYTGCANAVAGIDDEALARLDLILLSKRLPWYSMLADSPCFKRYADNPRYQLVLHHIESHQAMLRDRLPNTLKEFGVAL